ncbi:MAG: hypothetical protein RLZ87_556 [Armatimonadota bacterium]
MITSFGDLKKGMCGTIVSAPSDSDHSKRLQEMGFVPGTEIRIVKVAPLGDPMEVDLRGYRLCVRKQEMSGFEVEVLS